MPYIPIIAIALVLILDAVPWYTSKKRQRKETSGRMWTRVIIAIALISLAWWGLFTPWVNKDWVSDVAILNPEGDAGTAYIAYYPGRSSFQQDIANAFAEGLVTNGWRVEIGTISSQAPTDLSQYDLVVLGSPTYFVQPAQRVLKYVKTLDLSGINVVVLASGLVTPKQAASELEEAVSTANGNIIKSVAVTTGSGMEGITNPKEIGREAALAIPLP